MDTVTTPKFLTATSPNPCCPCHPQMPVSQPGSFNASQIPLLPALHGNSTHPARGGDRVVHGFMESIQLVRIKTRPHLLAMGSGFYPCQLKKTLSFPSWKGVFHVLDQDGESGTLGAGLERQKNVVGKRMRSILLFPVFISKMENKGRAGDASTYPQFQKKTQECVGKRMRSILVFVSNMENKGRAGGASTHPQLQKKKKSRNLGFIKTWSNWAGSDSINPQDLILFSSWIFGGLTRTW